MPGCIVLIDMKLVIIDDNAAVRTTLRLLLTEDFDQVLTVGDPKLIPAVLRDGDVDAVLLDMNFDRHSLDGAEGIFWLSRIKESTNPPAVVMITAFGDVPLAVEAMKLGAEDFVTKPWDNDDLKIKLRKAIDKNRRQKAETRSIEIARELEANEKLHKDMTLDEVKMSHVEKIMDECGGNLSAAATRLGITRQTLYNILKKK